MMKRFTGIGLVVALSFGVGCGDDGAAAPGAPDQAAVAAAQVQAAAAAAAAQAAAAAAPAAPAAGDMNSNFGTITLAPGFTPDPHVEGGTAGAGSDSRDASTLDPNCGGTIDLTPDHILVMTGASSNLRIMANSNIDTTIVVQKPDGSYACNDDGDGLNPVAVITGAAAGNYRIWLGTYVQGEEGDKSYKLGVSELTSVTPSHANLAL